MPHCKIRKLRLDKRDWLLPRRKAWPRCRGWDPRMEPSSWWCSSKQMVPRESTSRSECTDPTGTQLRSRLRVLSSQGDFLEEEQETSYTAEGVLQLIVNLPDTEVLSTSSASLTWSIETRSSCHLSMESCLRCPSTGKGKPAPELCQQQAYICTKYTRPASFFAVLSGAKTSPRPLAWVSWTPVVEDHSSASLATRPHPSHHIPSLVLHTNPHLDCCPAWFVT